MTYPLRPVPAHCLCTPSSLGLRDLPHHFKTNTVFPSQVESGAAIHTGSLILHVNGTVYPTSSSVWVEERNCFPLICSLITLRLYLTEHPSHAEVFSVVTAAPPDMLPPSQWAVRISLMAEGGQKTFSTHQRAFPVTLIMPTITLQYWENTKSLVTPVPH